MFSTLISERATRRRQKLHSTLAVILLVCAARLRTEIYSHASHSECVCLCAHSIRLSAGGKYCACLARRPPTHDSQRESTLGSHTHKQPNYAQKQLAHTHTKSNKPCAHTQATSGERLRVCCVWNANYTLRSYFTVNARGPRGVNQ